jgi:hypothetical protein
MSYLFSERNLQRLEAERAVDLLIKVLTEHNLELPFKAIPPKNNFEVTISWEELRPEINKKVPWRFSERRGEVRRGRNMPGKG